MLMLFLCFPYNINYTTPLTKHIPIIITHSLHGYLYSIIWKYGSYPEKTKIFCIHILDVNIEIYPNQTVQDLFAVHVTMPLVV